MIGDKMANQFVCKICGKRYDETKLRNDEDFCVCEYGYGCREAEMHINIFRHIYKKLMRYGNKCSPRGESTLEIENFSYSFPPYIRFVNFDIRKLNLNYIKHEFLWYLKGDRFDTSIAKHAKMWNEFINLDGSINSNYGQYIFGSTNQFNHALNTLKEDINSRRAVIMILQPYHLTAKWKEIPCTYCISFRIRNDKLNMSVRMRSQDSYLGFASDIPIFSFIHEMMFISLKEKYEFLTIGEYNHCVDSFHIYERHFNFAQNIVNGNYKFSLIKCPKISSAQEVEFLIKSDFNNIPENFEFSKWLMQFD